MYLLIVEWCLYIKNKLHHDVRETAVLLKEMTLVLNHNMTSIHWHGDKSTAWVDHLSLSDKQLPNRYININIMVFLTGISI